MKSIIAVDIGTTHLKAIAFQEDGEQLFMVKSSTPLVQKEGASCYESETLWNAVKKQIDELYRQPFCRQNCIGISVTGMAEAGLILSRDSGTALTDILPWFDKRTAITSETLDSDGEEELFAATGLKKSFKYGIYKFLWLKQNYKLPDDMIWLSVCDYIVFRLTGRLVTEPTFAARTYVYDIKRQQWDEQRIRGYGLELHQFPRVAESGKVVGYYQNIPVALAGHDHILAAYSFLFHVKEQIIDSAGTSETYIGFMKEAKRLPNKGLLYGPFVDEGYFYMANIPSSGHSVEWFRKKMQIKELSYEEMNRCLQGLAKDPTGLLYFPYLTGMGAPFYDQQATGKIFGLTREHSGAMILKGILEGINYQARWLLALLKEQQEVTGKGIICAGGSVHNETMMQIKADILNQIVAVPDTEEATLLGAAALFLHKNIGFWAAEKFLQKSLCIKKSYIPDKVRAKAYDHLFQEWLGHV